MTIQLEKLVAKLELDNKGFKSGLVSAAAGVTALVAGMAIAVKATMDWAKDLDSLGDVMDGSKIKLAALAFVARKSGVGVDTLAKASVMLEKSLFKSNGRLDVGGKKLKEYGINAKDVNGKAKDTVQIIGEVGKKYAELSTQTERVNLLTEIFGKNGATLVDFFDTLAKEGGIDKVAQKVKAFGLAIDPDRYEQFNRNLEELKLIGLGLAVQFTEKVMPVLERFLGWIEKAAQSPTFQKLKENLAKLFDFGTPGGTKFDLKNQTKKSPLEDRLMAVINTVDWKKLADDMDTKLAEGIRGKEWNASGEAFGEQIGKFITDFFTGGNLFDKSSLGDRWLLKLAAPGIDALVTFFSESKTGQAISNAVIGWFDGVESGVTNALRPAANRIKTWVSETSTSFKDWSARTVLAIQDWAVTFIKTVDVKMREIAKAFFNGAVHWTAQMIAGFKDGINGLLDIVQGVVDSINNILKGIVTTFKINISSNAVQLSGGTIVHPTAPDKTKDDKYIPHKATGGAVLAGHAYNVNEWGKPEIFTPNTSGRVDPMKAQSPKELRLDKHTIRALGREIQMNSLKAV